MEQKTFYVSGLRQIFNDYNFTPNVYIESDFGGMILSLVGRGLGVSIMPSSYAYGASADVRFINLPQKTNLYVTWRRDDKNPVLKNVLKEVERVAKEFDVRG
ncbi:MAG TPA: LysR substrate-binding domain-containing protein [Flavisolibacter sp.]|nr:LysR substrate-binding domain-containing protein [Flavisolibacter sp.]